MRHLCLPFICGALLSQIQASDSSSNHHLRTDLYPILRLESTSRFFDDEAAFLFVGELGQKLNRVNATFGFLTSCGHHFKFGGEILNQEIKYFFPSANDKGWVRQYAAGGVYQTTFGCGKFFKSFDIAGQYSDVSRYRIHDFYEDPKERDKDKHGEHHHHHSDVFNRTIAGTRAYAFSVGLTVAPWYGALLTGAAVYDRVDYLLKFSKNRIVEGAGGTVNYEQRLFFDTNLVLKAELRAPYDYYEGKLQWGTTFYYGDVTLGLYGGWTKGKRGLPDTTVAGVEIDLDYALTNYSRKSSVGVCGDSPYGFNATWGEDPYYMAWLAQPAVYIPQVLAISEQRLIVPPEKPLHHHRHHHRDGKHKHCRCRCIKNTIPPGTVINDGSFPLRDEIDIVDENDNFIDDPYN